MTTIDRGSRSSPLVDRNLRQLTIMRGPNHRRSTDTTASSRTTSDRIFSWIRFTRPVPKSFGSSENPHSGLAPDSEHQQQASPTKQVIPQHHRHGLHGLAERHVRANVREVGQQRDAAAHARPGRRWQDHGAVPDEARGGADQGSVALSLCTTAHPLYTKFANIFGTSVSKATMRPDLRW